MPQTPPRRAEPDDEWETVEVSTATQGEAASDDEWEVVTDGRAAKPENRMGVVSALSAAGAAAIPAAKGLAERLATSPMLTRAASLGDKIVKGGVNVPGIGGVLQYSNQLNVGKQLMDVYSGKQSIPGAVLDAGRNWAMSHPGTVIRGAQTAAGRVATVLGSPAALPVAGGLAGVAGTAGFLGALQHDANRTVPMDYTKRNLTEDIARALGSTGATDAQMDDPNHPAFRADDSATVTAGPQPGGSSVSAAVAAFFGRRGN